MKISWQQELKNRIHSLSNENLRLNQIIATQAEKIKFLERVANGPPIVMEACGRIVDAAAHQVGDMLQYVREVKHR